MDRLILEQTVTIEYQCRDIGYGVESGEATGRFTGEIDTWGKYTFQPDGIGLPLYLFADERRLGEHESHAALAHHRRHFGDRLASVPLPVG
jgi:hypothetical protein